MRVYGGFDLHSNNSMLVLLDEEDRVVHEERLANDLATVLGVLEAYRSVVVGVVVESTFNWYWLVDGLMEAGYRVHLANPAALKQYAGLKYSDDRHDARWLAHLLRLGLLAEGYIYPREERAVRDLMRKRSQLVRQRTANVLSIENLMSRNLGHRLRVGEIGRLSDEDVDRLLPSPELALAIKSNLAVCRCLEEQIETIEKVVKGRVRLRPEFRILRTVDGIGEILGLTIMLETGDIRRFERVGKFASYCRCVDSNILSNGKRKGRGNVKNGNRYLAWAFVEAAHFAIRFNAHVQKFFQRKKAKTKEVVAIKAVAHKLARATYWVLRDGVPFDASRAFS